MIPNRHAMVGQRRMVADAIFVGAFSRSSAGAIIWPTGANPLDWAVVVKPGSSPPGTWDDVTDGLPLGSGVSVYLKQLQPSDLISPPTVSSAFAGVVYRDLSDVVVKQRTSHQGPPGSEASVLGFTKSTNCGGRIGVMVGTAGFSLPTMSVLTSRVSISDSTNAWAILDQLDSSAFSSGSGVNITWDTTDPSGPGWGMFEILRAAND